ncbi:MAG: TauD/TfdA family dioxygenase [Steroidobacteraceae bacterium]
MLKLHKLSAAVGVQVEIDLSEPISTQTREELGEAWRQHHLILVRGRPITLEQQRRLCEVFGSISQQTGGEVLAARTSFGEQKEMYISNSRPEGVAREGAILLHQDHCFTDAPLLGLSLYAEECTRSGGQTVFSNAQLAAEQLMPSVRDRVAALRALHVIDPGRDEGTERFRVSNIGPNGVRAEHPVLLPHPQTGEPILYVNELLTDSIVGLSPDDSETLLTELCGYLSDERMQYEHEWQPYDLLIWDNMSLQHGRRPFASTERRSLRRLQIH